MSCCTNILNLGCFSGCKTITLTLNAPVMGVYLWHFTGNSGSVFYDVLYSSNEPLTIDLTKLNELDVFEVWLEMPDGSKYDFAGSDCLKISTIIENGI
jgi:hypothetical protein